MGRVKTQTTTEAIGYQCQDDALKAIYNEENSAMLASKYDRPDELRKVRKVVGMFRTGMPVRALVYKFTYQGTVLGYKRGSKGWMMGLLLCSGKVKDVSIDPRNWWEGDETTFADVGETIYVIFKHGYRLVLEPMQVTRTSQAKG